MLSGYPVTRISNGYPGTRSDHYLRVHRVYALCSDSNVASTRRSSRAATTAASETSSRRHRDSVISTILRQEIERRKSLKDAADGPCAADQLLPATSAAFELPGIHISRIETMDFDDDEEASAGSR